MSARPDASAGLRSTLRHHRLPLVTASIGIGLSICAFVAVIADNTEHRRAEFSRLGAQQIRMLADELHDTSTRLQDLRSFLRATPGELLATFRVVAADMLALDGLTSITWQGRDGSHETIALDASEHALAFYHGDDIAHARVVERATAHGAATRLAVVLPIHARQRTLGSIIGLIDIDALTSAALAGSGEQRQSVAYLLDSRQQPVYGSSRADPRLPKFAGDPARMPLAGGDFVLQTAVALPGQRWTLLLLPTLAYLRGAVSPYSWIVLAGGLTMTALVSVILLLQLRQNLVVGERVAEQTRDLRRMAQASARTEARLRAIFETSVDGVVTISRAGVIEDFNPACERIFGYTVREAVGRDIRMLMPEPEGLEQEDHLRRFLETGDACEMGVAREVRARRRDGSIFPMELAIAPMQARDGAEAVQFSGVIRDITERQQLLQRLRESNQELEQFAYVASHDLKAPLRGIENLVGWIEDDIGDLHHGDTGEHMRMLRTRVQRMRQLLDDLLTYSRIGRESDGEAVEVVDCASLVDEVVVLLAPPPSFRVVAGPECTGTPVDRIPLQQVLQNLLGNAIKHHDREDGMVRVDVARDRERLYFRVEDDGPGIAPKHHARVFEMFQTLHSRERAEGSGMGLALVRKIVTRHGGDIRVESTPGEGARFIFDWPVAGASATLAVARAGGAASGRSSAAAVAQGRGA